MPSPKRHNFSLRVAKTTKRGAFRVKKLGATAQRALLYSAAYQLALKQIPALQMREKWDISLRIHGSIRRQLKAGETDPNRIAFAAVKEVLVPDTH
jgi:hypothetical protein